MKFVNKFKYFSAVSIAVILIGLLFGVINGGLNWGIDFTGGLLITMDMGQEFESSDIEGALAQIDIHQAQILHTSQMGQAARTQADIRVQSTVDQDLKVANSLIEKLKDRYPNIKEINTDSIGGVASQELTYNAIFAVVIACALMLVYIWWRFRGMSGLSSGLAAIISLIHDVAIMFSFMAILQMPINSSFIAAVLTIVGYSINNTIIIFDRIRENKKRYGGKDFNSTIDQSIQQTLTRTINTSLTTLITISVLYILGVTSIREFSLPIIVGLVAGTYSSVFLAGPTLELLTRVLDKDKNKGKKKAQNKNKMKTKRA